MNEGINEWMKKWINEGNEEINKMNGGMREWVNEEGRNEIKWGNE